MPTGCIVLKFYLARELVAEPNQPSLTVVSLHLCLRINTGASTVFAQMFEDATAFNQPIGEWEIKNKKGKFIMSDTETSGL